MPPKKPTVVHDQPVNPAEHLRKLGERILLVGMNEEVPECLTRHVQHSNTWILRDDVISNGVGPIRFSETDIPA